MARKSFLDHFRIADEDDEDYDEDDDYMFDDDDDDDDDYRESVFRKKKPASKPVTQSGNPAPKPSYSAPARDSRRYSTSGTSTATDKLVSFDGGQQRRSSSKSANEVFVIKPQEFDDAQTVSDFLKKGKAIVINMEGLQLEPAQRIIDFIGGACYGMGGELKAISANIFIAVPSSIEVTGDLRDEILNSTAGFSPHLG
ncbi:MAG: cell division protein SepF [Eubacterium sp.]|nr:cell division protein SepF [Eubacterium sp.]